MSDQNHISEQRYADFASFFLNHRSRQLIERTLVVFGVGLFTVHLLLYALHSINLFPVPLPPNLFSHPLNTLYTPFSVILIAEVYLLVYYLPTSFTRSVGKQLEIVCLIEIRSVFKYVYETEYTNQWPWETPYFLHTVSAVGLAVCLVLFYRLRPRREARLEENELTSYVGLKRTVAAILAVYLTALAVYSFSGWCLDVLSFLSDPSYQIKDPNSIFYGDFFTALILIDVLLLLISLWYIDDFGVTLRNCGFVISTIILRLSLSMDGWHAVAHAWFAGLLAVTMLLLQQGLKWRKYEM